MAVTFQQVCDAARLDLNDADKTRYSDADLLKFANDGVRTIFQMRPDLFIGNMAYDFGVDALIGATIPISGIYKPVLQDYIVFRAQKRDDEHVNDGHVPAALAWFKERLLG